METSAGRMDRWLSCVRGGVALLPEETFSGVEPAVRRRRPVVVDGRKQGSLGLNETPVCWVHTACE